MPKVTQPLCGRSETSLCPLACAPTLGCSSELPRTVLEVQTPWSSLRIRIITESLGLCKLDRSPSDSQAVLRSEAGTPAPHHRGKGKCRKRGVRAPLCRLERCWSFLSLAAHFGAPSTSAFDVWSLGAGVPCRPRSRNLQGAGGWEERDTVALALPLALLSLSPTPFF